MIYPQTTFPFEISDLASAPPKRPFNLGPTYQAAQWAAWLVVSLMEDRGVVQF
jgi:hypothetical protein